MITLYLKNVATLPENEKPSKEEYLKVQEWFVKNGIVHGDLQEKNVMYNPETKKLMFVDFDFGWSNDGKPLSKLDADEDWDYLL